MIYFIQAGEDGPIKIGTARNPNHRLSDLQCASPMPLRLLAVQAGGLREEFALHEKLKSDRLHGEWFRPSKAVTDLVAAAKANPPLPPLPEPEPPPSRASRKHPEPMIDHLRRIHPNDTSGGFQDAYKEPPDLPPLRRAAGDVHDLRLVTSRGGK